MIIILFCVGRNWIAIRIYRKQKHYLRLKKLKKIIMIMIINNQTIVAYIFTVFNQIEKLIPFNKVKMILALHASRCLKMENHFFLDIQMVAFLKQSHQL
jgi:hypothetical protein